MAASAHEFEAKMNDGSMRSMTEYKEWFQKESDSWSLIVSWNKLVNYKMGPYWSEHPRQDLISALKPIQG